MSDIFTSYEIGLTRLLERLGRDHPRYLEALTYQHRLQENIAKARLYGDNPWLESQRAEIVDKLNQFALSAAGSSFRDLETEPSMGTPKLHQQRLFPFLSSFGIDDASIFFGRDLEAKKLVAQIERDQVVVLNGLSGCGKSSLLKAGVIPRLQKLGYQVIYTSVIGSVIEDVLHEVEHTLNLKETYQDYVDALEEGFRKCPGRFVLIVDQFEQTLGPSHRPQDLEAFIRGISRLLNRAQRFASVVIALRADWLYFLDTSIRRLYPPLNVHSCLFTLDPLTIDAARDAIIRPLEARGVAYDESVVNDIVKYLQTNSGELAIGPYIQPIQLQIVLRALFSLAERKGDPTQALTRQVYQESGEAESILRSYLVNSIGNRSAVWQLLARFVAQDNKTGRTICQSELLAVPGAEDVDQDLKFLVAQGFINAYEAKGEIFYRLSHDYLVETIANYIKDNIDRLGWKLAEDWLANATVEWRESTHRDKGGSLLLEKSRYLHIYQYRDKSRLSDESRTLLILSALRYGHEGLGYWLSRDPKLPDDVERVTAELLSTEPEVQRAARAALTGCTRPRSRRDTVAVLDENTRHSLSKRLQQSIKSPTTPNERDAAAQALWSLQTFDSSKARFQVGLIVFRHWVQTHKLNLISYLLTALLVFTAIAGGLYVREALRGYWIPLYSLKGGVTPLVAIDNNGTGTIYAITKGGPGPREGCSLFVQQGEKWELRSRDFSKAWPTAMIAVPEGNNTVLYVAMYGTGVIRSKDDGKTWELVNRGLPSRGLTSLVADPDNPSNLYLATDDWRGVLRSLDGGDSWNFYDYEGEIYGEAISRLAYTRVNGGTLLAGTGDGRILAHQSDSTEWELRFGLPKGGIKALVVSQTDDRLIYAGTSRGVVLRSQNGGETWEVLGQPTNEFNITALAIAPDDPKLLYVSAYGSGGYTIWKSQDMGQSWKVTPGVGLPRTVVFSLTVTGHKPYRLVASSADGLFSSTDGGDTWGKESLNAPLASVVKVATSPRYATPVYAIVGGSVYVNDGSIYTNPHETFHEWIHGKGVQAEIVRTIVVDPENPRIAYAGVLLLGEWSVLITRDGGRTWQRTTPPPIEPVVPDTMSLAIAKTPDGKKVLYAGTVGCGIFRSENEGKSWYTFGRSRCDQSTDADMPSDVSFLAVDAQDANTVYAAAGQQMFRSGDGGHTWQSSAPAINSPITGMIADPIKSRTIYLITGSDGFWRSENGGEIWQRLGNEVFKEAELAAITTLYGQTGYLIVGASNGRVWTTSDGGETWRFIRENLAISHISSIATSGDLKGKILVSSLSDGMALFTPGQLFSGIR